MLNPSIAKLIKNYDSRYQMVIDVANLARHISEKAEAEGRVLVEKPVDMALNQLAENYDD